MRRAVVAAIAVLGLTAQAMAQTNSTPSNETATVTRAEIRELIDAAKATAKASRENVDYARVVPDLLFQILAKLDKLEDKLDKVENAIKENPAAARKR